MGYYYFNKDFQTVFLVLLTFFFTVSLMIVNASASIGNSIEIPDYLPAGTILLDEISTRSLIYVSADRSVLVFRESTPQLEKLKTGDILLIQTIEGKTVNQLFQAKHIIKQKSNSYGILVEVMPWQNHPPFISAIIAQPSTLEIGQRTYITCYAADKDRDALSYAWNSFGGRIVGNGPSITWIAPDLVGTYSVSCEVSDQTDKRVMQSIQLFVAEKFSQLNEREKELLRKFGWGDNRTIRWPYGYVEVYDATNFGKMQEVLDQWNEVNGGKVVFYLSTNPQSPVKITYDLGLRNKNLCGHIDTHWRSYRLYAAEITINLDCFCGYQQDRFGLYLHLFSGVVGFDAWKGEIIEKKDWQNFTLISEVMRMMINALYKVPPGYDLR